MKTIGVPPAFQRIRQGPICQPGLTAALQLALKTVFNPVEKGILEKGIHGMAIHIGIVGLPNVGKSTLFNALSAAMEAMAEAANFPFCTIEPNVGVVAVPDVRLDALARLYNSKVILPTSLEFVDIAGLVQGASQGEGLGNQFLSHIRQVDAIAHVVRCFDDPNITHVQGYVDPAHDVSIVETELLLKDLETLSKRLDHLAKLSKAVGAQGTQAKADLQLLEALRHHLNQGKPARSFALENPIPSAVRELCLLTAKPMIFIGNVSEDKAAQPESSPHFQALLELATAHQQPVLAISAAIEAELVQLPAADRITYLQSMGLKEAGLNKIIQQSYRLLKLITFFTAGPKETRAWTVPEGTLAPQAAGVIHTDFERGFIKAEVMRWDDLCALQTEAAVRQAGKLRIEGKSYVVQDGDVMHFRFNV